MSEQLPPETQAEVDTAVDQFFDDFTPDQRPAFEYDVMVANSKRWNEDFSDEIRRLAWVAIDERKAKRKREIDEVPDKARAAKLEEYARISHFSRIKTV